MQGNGTVNQSGLISVDYGSTALPSGTVPNQGALWGDCGPNGATHASIVLETDNALSEWTFAGTGGSAVGYGGK